MKQFIIKSRMFFLICFMSTMILTLACNAMFPDPVKDFALLSDSYLTVEFQQECPAVEDLNLWAEKNQCKLMTGYAFSNGKTAAFDKKLMQFLGMNPSAWEETMQEENVAIVNTDAQRLCYAREGQTFLPFRGTDYRVIGFFSEDKADPENRTDYILNQNAEAVKKSNYYTYVFLDMKKDVDTEKLLKSFRKSFSFSAVYPWRGGLSGSLDARPAVALVIAVCGCILCLNCAGYSGAWIHAQKKEFAVRRLVGASESQNHILLLKRFVGIWAGAYILGIIFSSILLYILSKTEKLQATRRLLGISLDVRAVILAGTAVFLIGFAVTEICRLGEKRRETMLGLRRGKI